jgi:hypothetical protein
MSVNHSLGAVDHHTAPHPEVADRSREKDLRRQASRQGLALRKSPSRAVKADGYGRYHLINPDGSSIVAGGFPAHYSLTLDGVEAWLSLPLCGTSTNASTRSRASAAVQ